MTLREQMFMTRDLSNDYQLIEVKYFDVSEELPEKYCQILNTKLDELTFKYKEALSDFEM